MAEEQSNNSNETTPARKRGPKKPPDRLVLQARFLKVYRKTGNITHACERAKIDRSTFYQWRDHDEAFKAQLPDIELEVEDTLELAAYERAVNGVPTFVVSQGHMVYQEIPKLDEHGEQVIEFGKPVYLRGLPLVERKYSDTLLTTLLKARMPEKYKDKQAIEHTGANGGPVQVHVFLPD